MFILLSIGLLFSSMALATPMYRITDLGTLDAPSSSARSYGHAINDSGQVIGQSEASGGNYHAFLYTESAGMSDLGTILGWTNTYGRGINSDGDVVGWGRHSTYEYAFLYSHHDQPGTVQRERYLCLRYQ